MSFALTELSGLIAGQQTLTGAVVGFEDGFVRVATEKGAVVCRYSSTLAAGDRVFVKNGVAEPAPVASQSYQV